MNEYELLSILFKILGQTDENIYEKLEGNKTQPDEILKIVKALKNAKLIMDRRLNKAKKSNENISLSPDQVVNRNDIDHWSPSASNSWNHLNSYVFDPKNKSRISNQAIIEAFEKAGLHSNARSKDGRKKILLIYRELLGNADDSKRLNILVKVLNTLDFSQTKGWIEVIKSGNHD